MKHLTIVVTDATAREIERLARTGRTSDPLAYYLALSSRPVRGDRWVKMGEDVGWWRLPERLTNSRRRR